MICYFYKFYKINTFILISKEFSLFKVVEQFVWISLLNLNLLILFACVFISILNITYFWYEIKNLYIFYESKIYIKDEKMNLKRKIFF